MALFFSRQNILLNIIISLQTISCLQWTGISPFSCCKQCGSEFWDFLNPFQSWFFPDTCPGVGLLDHKVALFLVVFFFKEPPYCSSQWLYQFTFSQTVQKASPFSAPSPAYLLFVDFLMMTILTCVVVSHFSFDLHLSNDQQC